MTALKTAIVRWLERRWYGDVPPNAVLRWCSSLFARAAEQRRREYLYGAPQMMRVGVPVIAVGNLTVGGAGKTPLTIALVEGLRARGLRPGVVSRGYGRRVNDLRRVTSEASAADVGDEPLLIARRTGVPVAVAPGRYVAARLLEKSGEIDVLIADDGLQHYTLMRDIEILVVDGRRGLGNLHVVPAGPLREPVGRGDACDFVVLNLGSAAPAATPCGAAFPAALIARSVTMQLRAAEAVALDSGTRTPLAAFAGQRVHAVAAIADPERFFATLRAHGIEPIAHPFPDHHAFVAADLAFGDTLPILMTEKDAVKCDAFATDRMHGVPVDASVPAAFLDALAQRVRATVAEART
ncbi:tetraacyldisaccharide 4'-kinase [Chiayiivirga flava]|uniref:Tetraacyldisaccharide 4'-kinase n=1 Tax=Chiayiivirga flava TaxID=659595 RepID=A0A7W8D3T3_9GAMM|nr:tetraacyldisaccharide 4'-kinase [Chiayiivirga flava]MBB5206952.1 tetraacyldisaccharide 4'-kinase [Chiayiivirga flava]